MGLVETKRVQRLLAQVIAHRKNCSFEDLESLLLAVGFTARKTSGSHVIFKLDTLVLSVPRRKPLKEHYVTEALALIGSLAE